MASIQDNPGVDNSEVVSAIFDATESVHSASSAVIDGTRKLNALEAEIKVTPTPDMIPRAGSNGKIDINWLPIEEPSPTRDDVAGTYKSAGTGISNTGFKLTDGADIATLFGKLDSVSESVSGSGSFITDVSISASGKTLSVTKTKGNPSHCTYCTYCSASTHCSYCNHCSYCSYCNRCVCSSSDKCVTVCTACTYDANCGDN